MLVLCLPPVYMWFSNFRVVLFCILRCHVFDVSRFDCCTVSVHFTNFVAGCFKIGGSSLFEDVALCICVFCWTERKSWMFTCHVCVWWDSSFCHCAESSLCVFRTCACWWVSSSFFCVVLPSSASLGWRCYLPISPSPPEANNESS